MSAPFLVLAAGLVTALMWVTLTDFSHGQSGLDRAQATADAMVAEVSESYDNPSCTSQTIELRTVDTVPAGLADCMIVPDLNSLPPADHAVPCHAAGWSQGEPLHEETPWAALPCSVLALALQLNGQPHLPSGVEFRAGGLADITSSTPSPFALDWPHGQITGMCVDDRHRLVFTATYEFPSAEQSGRDWLWDGLRTSTATAGLQLEAQQALPLALLDVAGCE